ncbi:MAG: murein biosynthesis integral membrane protein MurJ [Gemmatimonadota bacterium]|nr:murein biosynthesis integral membrane protein MurJ [Gemmatimonadota bacterium]
MAARRVAAGILVSRVLGLVRESVFAHYFGNGALADAWRAGLRIPNVIQNLLGEGSLSASFIPVYVRLLEEGKEREAGRVAGAVLGLLCLVAGLLAAAGAWGAPFLAAIVALLVVSAWALGILNSHRRFFVSYVAPALWNVAIIAAVLAGAARGLMGLDLLLAMAWGALGGGALQLLFQLPFAARHLRGVVPSLGRGVNALREVVRNFLPLVAARGAVNLSALLDLFLASFLAEAAVSMMGYAQPLYLLPISLFGISIAAAELPELSRDRVAGLEAVGKRTRDAVTRALFWLIPSAIGYVFFGDEVTAFLRILPSGAFGAGDAAAVGMLLAAFAVGLPASGTSRVVSSAFYALGDARTPARIAYLRIAVSALVGVALMFPLDRWIVGGFAMGAAGLAVGSTAGAWLELYLLGRRLGQRLPGPVLIGGPVRRCLAAAAVATLAGFGAGALAPAAHPLVSAAAVLLPFGLTYLAITAAMGISPVKLPRLRR